MNRRATLAVVGALAIVPTMNMPAHASMAYWITTFERLMGGLKVHDKQRSSSHSQTQQVIKKSEEAKANAVLAQEMAYKVADIKNRFSYETGSGEVACAVAESRNGLSGADKSQEKMLKAFSQAESGYIASGGDEAANTKNSLLKRIGHYCTEEESKKLGATYCQSSARNERNAGDSNAGPFLINRSYGPAEVVTAADYIDVLAPYPTIDPKKTDVSGRIGLINARVRAAAMSGARASMMGIAVSGMGGDRQ